MRILCGIIQIKVIISRTEEPVRPINAVLSHLSGNFRNHIRAAVIAGMTDSVNVVIWILIIRTRYHNNPVSGGRALCHCGEQEAISGGADHRRNRYIAENLSEPFPQDF